MAAELRARATKVTRSLKSPTRALRSGTDQRRLGEILAQRIEDEIISSGWRVGDVLGSEPELIERFGVSRSIFREAMRIVDHHGVAEMRRGPGGGLVVARPDIGAAVRAVVLQLEFMGIEAPQVHEARNAIELECARLAASRITPDGEQRLRDFLEAEEQRIRATRRAGRPRGDLPSHDFHVLLAELTGNPAMQVFVQMITRVLGDLTPPARSLPQVANEVHRAHIRIADAVIAGDVDKASRRMSQHLGSVMEYFGTEVLLDRKRPAVGDEARERRPSAQRA
jgi:DNA-binding FadR family transcriptional regulator